MEGENKEQKEKTHNKVKKQKFSIKWANKRCQKI